MDKKTFIKTIDEAIEFLNSRGRTVVQCKYCISYCSADMEDYFVKNDEDLIAIANHIKAVGNDK